MRTKNKIKIKVKVQEARAKASKLFSTGSVCSWRERTDSNGKDDRGCVAGNAATAAALYRQARPPAVAARAAAAVLAGLVWLILWAVGLAEGCCHRPGVP